MSSTQFFSWSTKFQTLWHSTEHYHVNKRPLESPVLNNTNLILNSTPNFNIQPPTFSVSTDHFSIQPPTFSVSTDHFSIGFPAKQKLFDIVYRSVLSANVPYNRPNNNFAVFTKHFLVIQLPQRPVMPSSFHLKILGSISFAKHGVSFINLWANLGSQLRELRVWRWNVRGRQLNEENIS
jgi:hypothetical protein